MKFGRVNLAQAVGGILAHSHKSDGKTFKKGRVLSEDDVAWLQSAGLTDVVVARIEDGDVHEDEAAAMLAAAVAGNGVEARAATTGRCNLYASADGLLLVDGAGIDAINSLDEALTVATLPPGATVRRGEMVATIKVIPFAASRRSVEAAAAAAAAGVIRLAAFRPLRAVLIQTILDGTRDSVLDKSAAVTAQRLRILGLTLQAEQRCRHDEAELADCLRRALELQPDLVMVIGASAIVDRRDVIPQAVAQAGGEVEHLGMPVDPGNLLLLARLQGRPLLGLPGCSRSPKFNGLDLVLNRIAAGIEVGRADIMKMGVGGLLQETAERDAPREPRRRAVRPIQKVAALVLGAGTSSRMGTANKLLADIKGIPMIRRVTQAAIDSDAQQVLVVTGHQPEAVAQALDGLDVTAVHNPNYAAGLSSSLIAGLRALPEDVDGVLVCLGDMPGLTPQIIDSLIVAFDPAAGRAICVPTCRGRWGNPVLFARSVFPEMLSLTGDRGARRLLTQHSEQLFEVETGDEAVLIDIDTAVALAQLQNG